MSSFRLPEVLQQEGLSAVSSLLSNSALNPHLVGSPFLQLSTFIVGFPFLRFVGRSCSLLSGSLDLSSQCGQHDSFIYLFQQYLLRIYYVLGQIQTKKNKNLFLPLYILYCFKSCVCVCTCAHGCLCKSDECEHTEARGQSSVSSSRKLCTSFGQGLPLV